MSDWSSFGGGIHTLPEAVAALDLQLTDDEIRSLEEPYTPHGPSWF